MLNSGQLGKCLARLINPDIFHQMNEQAVLFKLDEIWFNLISTAVLAEYFCNKCCLLIDDEPQLVQHMLEKHKRDVNDEPPSNDDEADRLMREAVHENTKKIQIQQYFRENKDRFAQASSITITTDSRIYGRDDAQI